MVIGASAVMALLLGILPSLLFGLAQLGAAPVIAALFTGTATRMER